MKNINAKHPTLRHTFFAFVLILCVLQLEGQVTLSGYISDSQTGERLIGATVFNTRTQKGTSTNAYGFFSLSLKPEIVTGIRFSFVGYEAVNLEFYPESDQLIEIKLVPGRVINEVLVTRSAMQGSRSEMNTTMMPVREIKQLPALGGEADLMKSIQLLPGFKSGGEATSGLYVRGGSPDQNLVMIDDVPLYYVNHLGGFVSIFNADILSDVKLVKGSFPARYGARLSSVIDVRMRDGNMKKREINGTFGMVTTKLSIEGPVKKDTSSFLLSARRFMYDLLLMPLSRFFQSGGWMGYSFYDVNGKFNHRFSKADRLYASFYMGQDELTMGYDEDDVATSLKHTTRWGNLAGAVRWNHVFSPRLFANFTASYTQYQYRIDDRNKTDSIQGNDYFHNHYSFQSKIQDVTLKTDLNQYLVPGYELRYGAGGTYHYFLPVHTQIELETGGVQKESVYGFDPLHAFEGFAYLENILQLGKSLDVNIGGRYSVYAVNQKIFTYFEPRAMVALQLGSGYSLKAGYTQMNQFVHLMTGEGMGFPADYWVPAADTLPPSRSVQYGLAFEREDPLGEYRWSIEPYYKTMSHLIAFKEGYSNLYTATNWQQVVEKDGKGESYGVELFFRKMHGKNTGWIGYTLAWTNRQFENINSGRTYPFRYDRRHDISIVYNRKIKENIDFSATWVFATGNAFTLATARHFILNSSGRLELAEVYGEKNSFRMKPYHRLDVGINFHKKTQWGE
nr:TonB-dependent receptor [Prolixibacteraceae bacterium]